MSHVVEALIEALGDEVVVTGDRLRERVTSYWNAAPTRALAMLLPRTTEAVSRALAICHAHGQTVITQGGRTSCTQAAEPFADEIILSTERLDAIEPVDGAGGTVVVEAGVILQQLQERVVEDGWLFPLDLGARGSCTIGGNIATNAGGINVLRYGMMRNLVLGLEVVLADGTVLSSMNQMLKNNAGFDLKQWFIGTEGTLGVVTRAVLRLFPLPSSRSTALLAVQDFDQVLALLPILQRDLAGSLCAFEVMWGQYYAALTVPGGHRPPLSRDYPLYVLIETEGVDASADQARFERVLEQVFDANLVADAVLCKSEQERRNLWDIREQFELITANKPCFLYDVSLPLRHMARYADDVRQRVIARWPAGECYVFGHVADGNLHLFVCPGVDADHAESDPLVYESLPGFAGSVSAEHGIGLEKRPWLSLTRSDEEIALMQQFKRTLDPKGILNRGRVISW